MGFFLKEKNMMIENVLRELEKFMEEVREFMGKKNNDSVVNDTPTPEVSKDNTSESPASKS